MYAASRRRFLADLGRGMVVASIGSSAAMDLGMAPLLADDEHELTFGNLEPLVDFLQATPPEKMLPAVVQKIRGRTSLNELISAAALANSRAFGGEDYIGFHTLMALSPALHLAEQLGGERAALPVLKVLYRNSSRLQDVGGAESHVLRPVSASELPSGADSAEFLRNLVRGHQDAQAESIFAGLAEQSPEAALNSLLLTVEDGTEVHRVVLVHRAWDMVSLVGSERAHTLLRQSLRFCLKNETVYARNFGHVRTLLPKILDQHRLIGRTPGERTMDDSHVTSFAETLFTSTADQAADAAAAALAEGFAPAALAEAISLAANQLVLRDVGRRGRDIQPGKPEGSVHGDSIGVHACDSANAWRNIARYGDRRHALAATVLAGYQVAQDRVQRGGDFVNWKPRPTPEALEQVKAEGQSRLLDALHEAIRGNEQELACAITHRYLEESHATNDLFSVFARYATSEDGALHAEKYFRTVQEEYAATRPTLRNRQLVALARVTASEYGHPAPGYAQACELLGVEG